MNGFKSQQHRWTKARSRLARNFCPPSGGASSVCHQGRSNWPFDVELCLSLLACLCVLLHPSPVVRPAGVRAFLIDLPIFLTASLSVAVFYICAQRELNPRTWMKEMLLLPCLLALGVGLSLNNARAVLEAMFNHQSDFARTPKYGIERKAQPWRDCKYMPLKSLLPIAEMAFAAYFSYFVWFAIAHHQFLPCRFS